MGYVCVCNAITHDEVKAAIQNNECKQPIDIFVMCGKQPRCCTCFDTMSTMINDNPSNIHSIDDISDSGVDRLKNVAIKSLPHIWRTKRENGSITFYKNEDCVTIEVINGKLTFTDQVSALDQPLTRQWFEENTSILQ